MSRTSTYDDRLRRHYSLSPLQSYQGSPVYSPEREHFSYPPGSTSSGLGKDLPLRHSQTKQLERYSYTDQASDDDKYHSYQTRMAYHDYLCNYGRNFEDLFVASKVRITPHELQSFVNYSHLAERGGRVFPHVCLGSKGCKAHNLPSSSENKSNQSPPRDININEGIRGLEEQFRGRRRRRSISKEIASGARPENQDIGPEAGSHRSHRFHRTTATTQTDGTEILRRGVSAGAQSARSTLRPAVSASIASSERLRSLSFNSLKDYSQDSERGRSPSYRRPSLTPATSNDFVQDSGSQSAASTRGCNYGQAFDCYKRRPKQSSSIRSADIFKAMYSEPGDGSRHDGFEEISTNSQCRGYFGPMWSASQGGSEHDHGRGDNFHDAYGGTRTYADNFAYPYDGFEEFELENSQYFEPLVEYKPSPSNTSGKDLPFDEDELADARMEWRSHHPSETYRPRNPGKKQLIGWFRLQVEHLLLNWSARRNIYPPRQDSFLGADRHQRVQWFRRQLVELEREVSLVTEWSMARQKRLSILRVIRRYGMLTFLEWYERLVDEKLEEDKAVNAWYENFRKAPTRGPAGFVDAIVWYRSLPIKDEETPATEDDVDEQIDTEEEVAQEQGEDDANCLRPESTKDTERAHAGSITDDKKGNEGRRPNRGERNLNRLTAHGVGIDTQAHECCPITINRSSEVSEPMKDASAQTLENHAHEIPSLGAAANPGTSSATIMRLQHFIVAVNDAEGPCFSQEAKSTDKTVTVIDGRVKEHMRYVAHGLVIDDTTPLFNAFIFSDDIDRDDNVNEEDFGREDDANQIVQNLTTQEEPTCVIEKYVSFVGEDGQHIGDAIYGSILPAGRQKCNWIAVESYPEMDVEKEFSKTPLPNPILVNGEIELKEKSGRILQRSVENQKRWDVFMAAAMLLYNETGQKIMCPGVELTDAINNEITAKQKQTTEVLYTPTDHSKSAPFGDEVGEHYRSGIEQSGPDAFRINDGNNSVCVTSKPNELWSDGPSKEINHESKEWSPKDAKDATLEEERDENNAAEEEVAEHDYNSAAESALACRVKDQDGNDRDDRVEEVDDVGESEEREKAVVEKEKKKKEASKAATVEDSTSD